MINPFARAMQRSMEAMLETLQEELGKVTRQLVEGMLTPEMLSQLMQTMQAQLGGSFDMGQFASMMSQQRNFDPYKVLDLDRSATDEEVKKRYHEMVFILHPDKSGTQATSELFHIVQMAYEAIMRERGRWQ